MARYFFHVQDGHEYRDLQGTVLPDLRSARVKAARFAASLLTEMADTFWQVGEWTMVVTDEDGLTLFHLTFFATDAPALGGHKPAGSAQGHN